MPGANDRWTLCGWIASPIVVSPAAIVGLAFVLGVLGCGGPGMPTDVVAQQFVAEQLDGEFGWREIGSRFGMGGTIRPLETSLPEATSGDASPEATAPCFAPNPDVALTLAIPRPPRQKFMWRGDVKARVDQVRITKLTESESTCSVEFAGEQILEEDLFTFEHGSTLEPEGGWEPRLLRKASEEITRFPEPRRTELRQIFTEMKLGYVAVRLYSAGQRFPITGRFRGRKDSGTWEYYSFTVKLIDRPKNNVVQRRDVPPGILIVDPAKREVAAKIWCQRYKAFLARLKSNG